MSEILLKDVNKFILPKNRVKDTYDIVNEYPWTITPNEKRPDVPIIKLVEYEQDLATFFAQISYWSSNIPSLLKTDGGNPYENLYHANNTKTTFILPYFGEYNHNISQSWDTNNTLMESFGKIGINLVNAVGMIGIGGGMSPGININQPKKWNGTSLAQYDVTFMLFNILNDDDYMKNKKFIERIIMSSLHDQKSPVLAGPPALFTIDIPGIRYSPAAVLNNVIIRNSGQMNMMYGQNVPDAFEITLNISELIQESRQIYKASITGDFATVKAIDINETLITAGQKQLREYAKPKKKKPTKVVE